MNIEHAAKRYLQIRALEDAIGSAERGILDVQKEIDGAEERLSELRSVKNGLMKDLREAARDEGSLPLIDLAEGLACSA